MKIIDAFWEKRNLGVTSYEIVVSEEDTIQEFLNQEKTLVEQGAKYIVAKVPVNLPDFLFKLPNAGYIFMEASFALSLKKANYVCPPHVARFDRNMEIRIAESPDDRQRVFDEIGKGIFNTDRIALDKDFSQDIANTRYINWMKDLVDQGNIIYEVFSHNKPMGFYQLKKIDDNKAQGILTGVYEEYATSGLGTLVMKKLYDTVWALGYKIYFATVVTNNLKALRSNLIFGSDIDAITYHYIKHIE